MTSIRARFIRGEEVKYISHLDLMKAFERALRRANLPIGYSQGFNPHPLMIFGLPLSVGVTSEAEYADFELSTDIDTDEFIRRLNSQSPEGLKVVTAGVKLNKINIMASVTMASYKILVCSGSNTEINTIRNLISELMRKTEVKVLKETKNGPKVVEIRSMIHELEAGDIQLDGKQGASGESCSNAYILEYARNLADSPISGQGSGNDSLFCLSMLLSAGSASNLRPELIVSALNGMEGTAVKQLKIHRTGLFVGAAGKMLDPLDPAVLQV